jgi:glutamate-ammonia-ligase adenylyltransferase
MDVRLRPYGEGALAYGLDRYVDYYRDHAQLWEIQALGKARYAAGNASLGAEFFDRLLPVWRARCQSPDLKSDRLAMRQRILAGRCKSGNPALEFKTGEGGTVDVEFAVQYWQMKRGVFEPNTFKALTLMAAEQPATALTLTEGYTYLRLLESTLRVDDNQGHSHLPADTESRAHLGKLMGCASLSAFDEQVATTRHRVRAAFNNFFASTD